MFFYIPFITPILRFLASIFLTKIIYNLYCCIKQMNLKEDEISTLAQRYGENTYAIITGATSGIGLEFALQLASLGFNIVNISRSAKKLEEVGKQIKEVAKDKKNFKLINLKKDFTQCHKVEFFEEIEKELEGLDISMLINNVGTAWETDKPVEEAEEGFLRDMIVVNCNSQLGILKTFLPKLLKRSKKSGVIDVSSLSSCTPCHIIQTYASTKVFNRYLTMALSGHLNKNIEFLSLQPGYVETNMTKTFHGAPGMIMVDECVRGALSCLGKFRMSCGGKGHITVWYKAELIREIFSEGIIEDIKKFLNKTKIV